MALHQEIKNSCRLIAFYLPQFHPIPENDMWWGEGFTEWTNVRKAVPRFSGHYQPHIPGRLGYYDLRDPQVRQLQADLARENGIHGFCYYHYWFNGKMLLERPFNEVMGSGKPDFPFCLCWANENWTRAWDGLSREVLIAQDYSRYDHMAHFKWLAMAFADSRYIRIDGRPLFLIYRVEQIPQLKQVLADWRMEASALGIPGIYVCGVNNMQFSLSWDEVDDLGLDALVDFQPNPRSVAVSHDKGFASLFGRAGRMLERMIVPKMRGVYRYSYEKIVNSAIEIPLTGRQMIPTVFPSWDNSPRRRTNVTVIQNDDADMYGCWLGNAVKRVAKFPADERIVFINAWNEWAEGCHLEPDQRNGSSFLEATRRVVLGKGSES